MDTNQLLSSKPDQHPIGPKPLVIKDGSVRVKIYGTWVDSKRTDPATGYALKHYLPHYAGRYYWKISRVEFLDLSKRILVGQPINYERHYHPRQAGQHL